MLARRIGPQSLSSLEPHRAQRHSIDVLDLGLVPTGIADVRGFQHRLQSNVLRPREAPLVTLRGLIIADIG